MRQSHVRLSSLVTRALLLASGLTLLAATPAVAQKGKPAANQAVSLTVSDRDGDLVRSDSAGVYLNGVDGVSATVNASSGDLVATFSTARHLDVTLGTPSSGQGPAPGTYEARRLYVHDIKSVDIGQTHLRIARILDFPNLTNHVVGFLTTQASGVPVGGTPVCVTRDAEALWTISTATDGCAPGGIGGLFTQENGRKGSIVITPLATYELPFSLMVQAQ